MTCKHIGESAGKIATRVQLNNYSVITPSLVVKAGFQTVWCKRRIQSPSQSGRIFKDGVESMGSPLMQAIYHFSRLKLFNYWLKNPQRKALMANNRKSSISD
jgi:hypothetical protein